MTLAWVYEDETTPAVLAAFDLLGRHGAWVPSLWRIEVANSLQTAVRRGRINETFRNKALADLELLPVKIDPETDRQAWGATLQLAASHRLTVYDASYLELAIRRQLPLATLDRELREAATARGVILMGI